MWLFTEHGFISAVTHRDDSNLMMVRARDKKSLDKLVEISGCLPETTLDADYPHRIVVSKKHLKEFMSNTIEEAMYDNFKTQVGKTRGYKFAMPLHDVWEVMHEVEDVKRRRWFEGGF